MAVASIQEEMLLVNEPNMCEGPQTLGREHIFWGDRGICVQFVAWITGWKPLHRTHVDGGWRSNGITEVRGIT